MASDDNEDSEALKRRDERNKKLKAKAPPSQNQEEKKGLLKTMLSSFYGPKNDDAHAPEGETEGENEESDEQPEEITVASNIQEVQASSEEGRFYEQLIENRKDEGKKPETSAETDDKVYGQNKFMKSIEEIKKTIQEQHQKIGEFEKNTEEYEKLKGEYSQLKIERNLLAQQKGTLENIVKISNEEAQAAKKENEGLKIKIDEKDKSLISYENQMQQYQQAEHKGLEKRAELEKELNQVGEKYTLMEKQKTDLANLVRECSAKEEIYKKETALYLSKMQEIEKTGKDMEATLEALKKKYEAKEKQAEEYSRQIEVYKGMLAESQYNSERAIRVLETMTKSLQENQ